MNERQHKEYVLIQNSPAAFSIGLLKGTCELDVSLQFRRDKGSMWNDVLFSTGYSILISEALAGKFRSENINGWDIAPVEVFDKTGEPVEGYHRLVVTGRCGELDEDRCKEIALPPFKPGLPERVEWRGIYFIDDYWDGSDVFGSPESARICVTEKAKKCIESCKTQNVEFEPLNEATCIPTNRRRKKNEEWKRKKNGK
jgi:hypothetical protein